MFKIPDKFESILRRVSKYLLMVSVRTLVKANISNADLGAKYDFPTYRTSATQYFYSYSSHHTKLSLANIILIK